jgi:hypothetical protein
MRKERTRRKSQQPLPPPKKTKQKLLKNESEKLDESLTSSNSQPFGITE